MRDVKGGTRNLRVGKRDLRLDKNFGGANSNTWSCVLLNHRTLSTFAGSTKDSNHEASLLRESQEETDIRECFNDSTRNIEKHVATQTKS
mmetsp:Transcript_7159/g.14689  ORF Transcript_7159/g.14689 Transcript_7159/m.14689 type:complete len:90 (-) Transcript_7159:123-392(-)